MDCKCDVSELQHPFLEMGRKWEEEGDGYMGLKWLT